MEALMTSTLRSLEPGRAPAGHDKPSHHGDISVFMGHAAMLAPALLGPVMDLIDYGLILMGPNGRVLHANATAWRSIGESHPLVVRQGRVEATRAADREPLERAVHDAALRERRTLMSLRSDAGSVSVSVLPVRGSDARAVLLVMERAAVCTQLSVQCFCSANGLTLAEGRVLLMLAEGSAPAEVARRHGVSVSTIRTQIASLRAKTGACSLRDLLRRVSALPPLVTALI